MTIGEKIKLRRKALGLYQSELADMVNVTQSYISRLENPDDRKYNVTAPLIVALAKALRCPVDYLLYDDEKKVG